MAEARAATIGSGLTEKPLVHPEDPEWEKETQAQTIEGLLAQVEEECFALMAKVGLPTFHGGYAYRQSGEWHEADEEHSFPQWGLANELWPIARARGFEYDSPEGFAARMLSDVVWCRRAREEGDHGRAAMFMYWLGQKVAEQRLKQVREKEWKTGKKQTDTLADQRERANTIRQREREVEWRRWNEEAAHIRSARPGLSVSAQAAIVIKKLGLNESINTVRARLNKVDKAG